MSKRLDLHINLVDNSKTNIQINYYNGKEAELIVANTMSSKKMVIKPGVESYFKNYFVSKLSRASEIQIANYKAWSKHKF